MIRGADIHARIGQAWPHVLEQLGVPEEYRREKIGKREKHGPCPGCGGNDRYFFDNKYGRGDYFCRKCGPGDGFKLLELVHGWSFPDARRRVMEAAGVTEVGSNCVVPSGAPRATAAAGADPTPAVPPSRVQRIRHDRCAVRECDDATGYLDNRGLWPLPEGCSLSAHATVEYRHEGRQIGRYPALLADVRDQNGELVTVHVTYLEHSQKLTMYEPRKILSPLTGRVGCAVQLIPATDVLGIAEGIETALSAALVDGVPVWAATNAGLLAKFEPPAGVSRLVIYADADVVGLTAACRLAERLQGRMSFKVRIPTAPAKDWNDTLLQKRNLLFGGRKPHE